MQTLSAFLFSHMCPSSSILSPSLRCHFSVSQPAMSWEPIIRQEKNPSPFACSRSPRSPTTAGRAPRAQAGWVKCRLIAGTERWAPSATCCPGPRAILPRRSWRASMRYCSCISISFLGKFRRVPVSFSWNVSLLFRAGFCPRGPLR